MLATIGDLVKSTFAESLKRPLQPSGLFAAAIFLGLNVGLIYPMLIDGDDPRAQVLRDSGAGTQAAIVALVLLVGSYMLSSLSNAILKLMTGESWSNSAWLGARLRRRWNQPETSDTGRQEADK